MADLRRLPVSKLRSDALAEPAIITRRGKPVLYLLPVREVDALVACYDLMRAFDHSVPERQKLDLPALRGRVRRDGR